MIAVGKIYTSNLWGDYRIIKYEGCRRITVKFMSTGYETVTTAPRIKSGTIKDYLSPSFLGIGFIGDGPHKTSRKSKKTKAYRVWMAMLTRCYSSKSHKHNPSYSDVTVCKGWHNFQNFAEWFYDNYIEGFHIDKDIKQGDIVNKVYSPEACSFVSQSDNAEEAHAKSYRMKDPSGLVHDIYNMTKFAKENGLGRCAMGETYSGKRNHHKGWTKA